MKKSKELSNKHDLLVEMSYVVLHILLKHKALHAWCVNTLSAKQLFHHYIDLRYIKHRPSRWLDYAFFWSNTPEGSQFWCNIYKEIENKTKYG